MASPLYRSDSPLRYEKQEIRLVVLLPGVSGQEIRCELQNAFLGDEPKYQALSYVWGNANETLRVFINDNPFNVTKNLYAALNRLRSKSQELIMWIDAICINQGDVKEKNEQVALMGNIYQNAEEVLVWLGEPDAQEDNLESGVASAAPSNSETKPVGRSASIKFNHSVVSAGEKDPGLCQSQGKETQIPYVEKTIELQKEEKSFRKKLKSTFWALRDKASKPRSGERYVSEAQVPSASNIMRKDFPNGPILSGRFKGQMLDDPSTNHFESPRNTSLRGLGESQANVGSSTVESQPFSSKDLELTQEDVSWLEDTLAQVRPVLFGKKPAMAYTEPPSKAAAFVFKTNLEMIDFGMQFQKLVLDSKRDPELTETGFPFSGSGSMEAINDFFSQERMHPEWPIIGACIILWFLAQDFHFGQMPFFEKAEEGSDVAFYGSKLWLESAAALDKILQLPYWSRVWIVQEVVLARRLIIQYGVHVIPSNILLLAVVNYRKHYNTCCRKWGANAQSEFQTWWYAIKDGFQTIDDLFQLTLRRETPSLGLTLLDILTSQFGRRSSTDPRDFIYGVLGLVTKWGNRKICPDYALTTAVVFARTAVKIMEDQSSLRLLVFNDIGHEERFSLPSWVPDWSCPAVFNPQPYPYHLFSASRDQPAFLNLLEDVCLNIKTIKVDVVRETGPIRTWKWYHARELVKVLHIWREFAGLKQEKTAMSTSTFDGDSEELFWRTVFADSIDNFVDGKPQRVKAEDIRKIHEWWHWLQRESMISTVSEWYRLTQACKDPQIMQTFTDRTESRKFFLTANGRIGTGAATIQDSKANAVLPGDEIHIAMGFNIPLVLRPVYSQFGPDFPWNVNDGEEISPVSPRLALVEKGAQGLHYRVVGTCYIHGIMNGEIMDNQESAIKIITLH